MLQLHGSHVLPTDLGTDRVSSHAGLLAKVPAAVQRIMDFRGKALARLCNVAACPLCLAATQRLRRLRNRKQDCTVITAVALSPAIPYLP